MPGTAPARLKAWSASSAACRLVTQCRARCKTPSAKTRHAFSDMAFGAALVSLAISQTSRLIVKSSAEYCWPTARSHTQALSSSCHPCATAPGRACRWPSTTSRHMVSGNSMNPETAPPPVPRILGWCQRGICSSSPLRSWVTTVTMGFNVDTLSKYLPSKQMRSRVMASWPTPGSSPRAGDQAIAMMTSPFRRRTILPECPTDRMLRNVGGNSSFGAHIGYESSFAWPKLACVSGAREGTNTSPMRSFPTCGRITKILK
mmetsp:Transcript_78346/g.239655  ORF Transcript_78346/g.239655 Transcript_78346/m.239655 type:complete len:260 (+) Transcript_78346:2162-2941(+)